ncbi:adhesion G-protein coupled receptor G7-like [Patiria miniata]|uniref:Uncharacterized protein n=1 Tax=Patiria miniata TaxID=46514 RepID=A0A913YWT8_PATMI|nr:adhesion G-protein coupled receptor G7-like [Patiria miniata]
MLARGLLVLVSIAAFFSEPARSQQGTDLTILPGARGTAVVEATVSKIDRLTALNTDLRANYRFIRRIAWVETADGTASITYDCDMYHGGIWRVDRSVYDITFGLYNNPSYASIFNDIQQILGINWSRSTWRDCRKPLYSAVAARLYFHSLSPHFIIPGGLNNQASLWRVGYHDQPTGTVENFIRKVRALESEECVQDIDLVFVLDSSGSVGSTDFEQTKNFVSNVVDNFNISAHETRVVYTCHIESTGKSNECGVQTECEVGDILEFLAQVSVNVVKTVDNVLNLPNEIFEKSDDDAAGRILQTFETQLTYIQENLTIDNLSNLAVDVVVLGPDLDTDSGISYASIPRGGFLDDTLQNNEGQLSSVTEPRDDAEAFIGLPGEALKLDDEQGSRINLPVVFAVYQTSKLFQLATPESLSFPDGRQLLVNSRIVSAIVGDRDQIIENLMSPVVASFISLDTSLTGESICVFWDTAASNWSTEGCSQSTVNPGQRPVACDCNHLTNFAILLSYYGDIDNFALDIISKVGCAVSIGALLLTIMACLVHGELRNNPAKKSVINLCVSLLALYAVFLAGIEQAQSPVTCVIMGALIHYFFLTSVCWASAEALNLFYLLVITRRGLMTGYLLKMLLFCWGLPMVIVACTFVVPYLVTGQWELEDEYCFLTPGNALYFCVLLPVGMMLLFNVFIFILLVRRLVCQRIESSVTRRETHLDASIRHGRLMLPISLLLGATWLVGFLAVEDATYFFQWIFAVLNSLLGLAIFLLFIVGKKTGRKGLGKLICVDQIRKMTSTQSSSAIRGSTPHGVDVAST